MPMQHIEILKKGGFVARRHIQDRENGEWPAWVTFEKEGEASRRIRHGIGTFRSEEELLSNCVAFAHRMIDEGKTGFRA
ncbi:hypothetical protein APR50_34945 [Variovorax paradoxus]|jgi:hypothetical protein|uniref:hypothetical protein n=2 Tax=Variovorax TaxID=34072 RepID=UPI0006E59258|nr:hypothetical protein [Variovorax sp. CY25R-8]KPU90536.1 hypothetical protein APR52_34675 [Variovorax paradoxus]MBS77539.1 hypothetical protein [Variovorax sp.]KPU95771.1 hypothetical protein APR49_37205 [Variovorax paradoxus]KPU97410.1 hypothetical protein APR50_34945 [Variovorax paradoxus]KPV16382.1 hypothetical protein APR51_30820 [Variovorax paradoxus]